MNQDATDWKAAALQLAGIKNQISKPEAASNTKLSQEIGVVKCTHFKPMEKEVTNSAIYISHSVRIYLEFGLFSTSTIKTIAVHPTKGCPRWA